MFEKPKGNSLKEKRHKNSVLIENAREGLLK